MLEIDDLEELLLLVDDLSGDREAGRDDARARRQQGGAQSIAVAQDGGDRIAAAD